MSLFVESKDNKKVLRNVPISAIVQGKSSASSSSYWFAKEATFADGPLSFLGLNAKVFCVRIR